MLADKRWDLLAFYTQSEVKQRGTLITMYFSGIMGLVINVLGSHLCYQ